jgi:hypothetical protein
MSDEKDPMLETVQLSKSAIEAMNRIAGGDPKRFKEMVTAKHPQADRLAADEDDRVELTLRLPRKSIEALDHLAKVSGRSREEVLATLISQSVVRT